MWYLTKKFSFEASHQLKNHNGKCKNLHGHSWNGELVIRGDSLWCGSESGMVMDYGKIKDVITTFIISRLDHQHLNDIINSENPTSEEVSRWIYNQVKPHILGLVRVSIMETATSRCDYEEI